MKHKNSSGFTLIELLVVISIIGLLASVVLVSLNGARIKARNVKRVGDIKQLTTAFSLGSDNGSALPDSGVGWVCISATCYGGWAVGANATVDAFLSAYVTQKAVDPADSSRGFGGYLYNSNWTGGTSPYDGSVLPAGNYITTVLEPQTVTGSSCGSAKIWYIATTYIQCLQVLN